MVWRLFASTFTLIFLAELPDKTFFASLIMATRQNPRAVFLGAALAFVVQSLVAVLFGGVLSYLPPKIVHIAAGVLFLVFALAMWIKKEEWEDETEAGLKPIGRGFAQTTGAAFLMIFVAEWGDLTQLATATLAAQSRSPVTIFASATLALWTVTILAVTLGHHAKKVIQPYALQKIAAAAFAAVGIVFLVRSFWP
jgi:putative Ca2+/H+ antiporter (TMEM165/GDT1 family)